MHIWQFECRGCQSLFHFDRKLERCPHKNCGGELVMMGFEHVENYSLNRMVIEIAQIKHRLDRIESCLAEEPLPEGTRN